MQDWRDLRRYVVILVMIVVGVANNYFGWHLYRIYVFLFGAVLGGLVGGLTTETSPAAIMGGALAGGILSLVFQTIALALVGALIGAILPFLFLGASSSHLIIASWFGADFEGAILVAGVGAVVGATVFPRLFKAIVVALTVYVGSYLLACSVFVIANDASWKSLMFERVPAPQRIFTVIEIVLEHGIEGLMRRAGIDLAILLPFVVSGLWFQLRSKLKSETVRQSGDEFTVAGSEAMKAEPSQSSTDSQSQVNGCHERTLDEEIREPEVESTSDVATDTERKLD